jgi:hypothetical protein
VNDRIECFGRTYIIRFDRSARLWYVSREDGSTYEPIDAPSRDMAMLFLGLRISADPNF